MSLLQIANTMNDVDFRRRVHSAVLKAAVQIVGEDPTGKSPELVSKRHTLGFTVLSGGSLDNFVKAVASQIGELDDPSTLTDLQIENSISAIWNDLAGVTYQEANS